MKAFSQSIFKRLSLLLAAGAMVFVACRLSGNDNVEHTISFNKIYDSLAIYDSVVIALKDADGHTLDIVFSGKVNRPSDVENLDAPHWDGGTVVVAITGYTNHQLVYKSESNFDGATNKKDSVYVFVYPGTSISSPKLELDLVEGDSIPLPEISVNPATLADKSLSWTSSKPDLLIVGDAFLKALKPGSVQLTIKLKSDPAKSLSIQVTIAVNGKIPESLALSAETLFVAAGGAPGRLQVAAMPSTASNAVSWRMDDSSIATLATDGSVHGVKKGSTRLWAISKEKVSIFDTARVEVSDPVSVASVRFFKDSVDLFIHGAAESLMVEVLPHKANPDVEFSLSDPAKIGLSNGRISGLVEGYASAYVASKADPEKKDTLYVHILPIQVIDSVRLSVHSLKLFIGGESPVLTAKVMPISSSPKVQWRSSHPSIAIVDAAGKVSPVSPGSARLYAVSQADSLKKDSADVTVKVDAPQVTVGKDTVISLGQTVSFLPVVAQQEFGSVVQFKWDFEGDLVWDDSSATVNAVSYKFDLEKEYPVRFYVRDTEGNQVIVTKKVQTVKGPKIEIVSPADNSFSRTTNITVKWTVNGVEQDSLKTATLKDGSNVVIRTVRDAAGTAFSSSITVTLDSLPPSRPVVVGSSPTSVNPKWTWSTGGTGGSGEYRYHLGSEPTVADSESKVLEYSLTAPVSGATYTLFVQERDAVGNWSLSGSLPIKYDLTKPSVTIQSPQGSGIFITSVDANTPVVVSGIATASTGNTLAKVTYSLDDGTPKDITPTMGSAWTLSVILPLEKTYLIKVIAVDNLNNTAEAPLSILRDHTAPPAPKIESSPLTPTNSTTGTWTWSSVAEPAAGSGVNGNYRYSTDAGATWKETTLLTATVSTLKEGSQNFWLQEQDNAKNWSLSTISTVVVDITTPDAVKFEGTDGSYTDTQAPTWKWNPSLTNGGIGTYVLKLDAGAEFDLSATTYTPTNSLSDNQTHTLTVKQRDQVQGVVGAAKSFSYKIKTNAAAAPFVKSAANVAANGLTNNPKFIWTSGGGGTGVFRYRINGEQGYHSITTPQNEFSIPPGPDGFYTLRVSEQDVLNRWGDEGAFTIDLDRTAPVVVIKSPADGFITNKSSVLLTYTVDGGADKTTPCVLVDQQENSCPVPQATDAAGNTGNASPRKVWMRGNVVFVRANINGSGSSWDDAGTLETMLTTYQNDSKEFWVAAGTHSSSQSFHLGTSTKLLGGFQASGYPNSKTQRDRITNKTYITKYLSIPGGFAGSPNVVDGFVFKATVSINGDATLSNSDFVFDLATFPLGINGSGSVLVENVNIVGQDVVDGVVKIDGFLNVEFSGGNISDNANGYFIGTAFSITDATVVFSNGLKVVGNHNSSRKDQASLISGSLRVKSGVTVEGGEAGIYVTDGATLIFE